jgi:hypothetical protein
MGHKAGSGKPFNPRTIKAMVDGPAPKVNGLSGVKGLLAGGRLEFPGT